PVFVEVFASGTLGRRALKVGIGEHLLQQLGQDLAGTCPVTVAVKGLADMPLRPVVHQDIARPAVESPYPTVRTQHGQVGKTSDVNQGPAMCGILQQPGMEGRYQRGALAASGQTATAYIREHLDAAPLGERRRRADLRAESRLRVVADGLPVAANGGDPGGLHVVPGKQSVTTLGSQPGPLFGGQAGTADLACARLPPAQQITAPGGGGRRGQRADRGGATRLLAGAGYADSGTSRAGTCPAGVP